MKKLLLLAFCLLAFPAFGQTLASPGGGSSATFPTICPAPVASGQILYDNAGACGGITGWTTNGTTTITGAASTTLAIGGATIGTNALAVTGTALFNNQVTNALGTITTSQPFTLTQTWNAGAVAFTGIVTNITNTASASSSKLMDLQIGSVSGLYYDVGGILTLTGLNNTINPAIKFFQGAGAGTVDSQVASEGSGTISIISGTTRVFSVQSAGGVIAAAKTFGWSPTSDTRTAADTILARDAANTLAQRNGVNAQVFRAYQSFTDASNFTRAILDAGVHAANYVTLGAENLGTGGTFGIQFSVSKTAGGGLTDIFYLDRATGYIQFNTDNVTDIGASASSRPRTVYLGTTDASSTSTGALVVAGGAVVAKRFWIPAITASAVLQTAVLCQSSGGEMIADSVACLASSARFKNLAGPMEDGALFKLAALPMRRWNYKPEGIFHNDVEHVGPIAEDVAAMDPRLAGYDKDGRVRTYSTEQLLAYTIKALQELKADNDNLRQEMKRASR